MSILVFCGILFVTATVFGGSPCPPRQYIYPCSCLNIATNRRLMHTAITCHRLESSDSLAAISAHLRNVQVDQFQLYDSFWQATDDSKKVLPSDLLRLAKVKAIEIVDTNLSKGFMCEWKSPWRNDDINRFTVINSSSSMVDELCPKEDGSVYPWTGGMTKLEHFQFSHGKLTTVANIFPSTAMNQLTIVNLTSNQISRIEMKAFDNLPQLTKLDLSHNLLEDVTANYEKSKMNNTLQFLDLSWNKIKSLKANFFSPLKALKVFKADHNKIVFLQEETWKMIPKSLKSIQLTGNPVHCGCNIKWIGSVPKNVDVSGRCITPREYKDSYLKVAANAVKKRCDEEGNFRTKKE